MLQLTRSALALCPLLAVASCGTSAAPAPAQSAAPVTAGPLPAPPAAPATSARMRDALAAIEQVERSLTPGGPDFQDAVSDLYFVLLGPAGFGHGPHGWDITPEEWWSLHDRLITLDQLVARRATAHQISHFMVLIDAPSTATAMALLRDALPGGETALHEFRSRFLVALGHSGIADPVFWGSTDSTSRALQWIAATPEVKAFFFDPTAPGTSRLLTICTLAATADQPAAALWALASAPIGYLAQQLHAGTIPAGPGGLFLRFATLRCVLQIRDPKVLGGELALLPLDAADMDAKMIVRYVRRHFTAAEHADLLRVTLNFHLRSDTLLLCRQIARLHPDNAALVAEVDQTLSERQQELEKSLTPSVP
jgi:hypothetical protein